VESFFVLVSLHFPFNINFRAFVTVTTHNFCQLTKNRYIVPFYFLLLLFSFLDKKLEGSAPKKTAKVTTPAVEAASDFDDDIPF
jgi:hypothetical protein